MEVITVVGAGVAGLTAALELSRRGFAVEVIDRSPREQRSNASWCAGGMLAPWCEAESAPDDVTDMGAQAIDWWRENAGGVQQNGTLLVTSPRDGLELDRFARRTRGWQMIGADEIAHLEPCLAGRFAKALYFAAEAHLDPRLAMAALEDRLKTLGVTVRTGDCSATDSGIVVDARGIAARDALDNLRGVRGEMLVLHTRDIQLSRPVRFLHPHYPAYIVPRGDGLFMVGATMIESCHDGPVTARSMMELAGAARAVHPAFGEAGIVEMAAAVRPAFADNLPAVKRIGRRVYVNGFYRHGFLLAPAMARRVCDEVMQIQTEEGGDNEDYRQWAAG